MVVVRAEPVGEGWRCEVSVDHRGRRMRHVVTVNPADLARWAGGSDLKDIEDLVARSFDFLLEREPDITVVGQAHNVTEARPLLSSCTVAIIDLDLAGEDGMILIKELHRKNPKAKTLVVTASSERVLLGRAIEAGAAGVAVMGGVMAAADVAAIMAGLTGTLAAALAARGARGP